MRCFLIAMFFCGLSIPAHLNGQTAKDCISNGDSFAARGEFDKAIAVYNLALAATDPKDPKQKHTIAKAYFGRAEAWAGKNELDKAIADYNQVLAIEPKSAVVYKARGIAWWRKNENDKAIADYSKCLAIDPTYAGAYSFRGLAWKDKGEYGKAIADYTKAIDRDSKDAEQYRDLAEIYATCPDAKFRDGKKAVEYASKARDASKANTLMGGKDWDSGIFHTLAEAYAESGDFAKAQECQAKAIELAPDEVKPFYRSRLELYKQGKPYHKQPGKK